MPGVQHRYVFYIAGFDPRGAGHYHRLYRTHAERQSDIGPLTYDVSLRKKTHSAAHTWSVKTNDRRSGDQVDTTVEFLVWDDIIRRYWHNDFYHVFKDLFYCLKAYIVNGAVIPFTKTSLKRLLGAGIYPVLYLILAISLAVFAGIETMLLAAAHIPVLLAVTGGVAVAGLLLKGFVIWGRHLAVFWLIRIYNFSDQWAQGTVAGLEEKIDEFAARIIKVMSEKKMDEVMIVSHSVGTMLAVPVTARVLRQMPPDQNLSLVTLGGCIPLISFHTKAKGYRQDLEMIAKDKRLTWADYTAPADGICFPQLDPVKASGISVPPETGPRILSPRFFKLYTKENYRRLKFKWYTMHFLYLMSTDKSGAYDYFAMTAGPETLAERLEGA